MKQSTKRSLKTRIALLEKRQEDRPALQRDHDHLLAQVSTLMKIINTESKLIELIYRGIGNAWGICPTCKANKESRPLTLGSQIEFGGQSLAIGCEHCGLALDCVSGVLNMTTVFKPFEQDLFYLLSPGACQPCATIKNVDTSLPVMTQKFDPFNL